MAAPIGPGTTAPVADQAAPQPVTGNTPVGLRSSESSPGWKNPLRSPRWTAIGSWWRSETVESG